MLVTTYGTISENDSLDDCLDFQTYLSWVRDFRINNDPSTFPTTDSEWVILYKRTLAKAYAERYFILADKLP